MDLEVTFIDEAEADLAEIYAYVAAQSPGQARRFTMRLRAHCERLSVFPDRGAPRDHLGPGMRLLNFERRVGIYYRVRQGRVQVIALLAKGRDVGRAGIWERLGK